MPGIKCGSKVERCVVNALTKQFRFREPRMTDSPGVPESRSTVLGVIDLRLCAVAALARA